jgi:hypothetical protein
MDGVRCQGEFSYFQLSSGGEYMSMRMDAMPILSCDIVIEPKTPLKSGRTFNTPRKSSADAMVRPEPSCQL